MKDVCENHKFFLLIYACILESVDAFAPCTFSALSYICGVMETLPTMLSFSDYVKLEQKGGLRMVRPVVKMHLLKTNVFT